MTWLYLDDGFPEHPKVQQVGGDAAWLYICGLAYVQRNNTRGIIPRKAVSRISDRRSWRILAQKLVDAVLWEEHEQGFMVHDYEMWNRQALERSDAARRAAEARWRPKPQPKVENAPASDPHMQPGNAPAMPEQCLPQSPSPIPQSLSSSNGSSKAPQTADEDDELWNLYANRKEAAANLSTNPAEHVRNPTSWRTTVITQGRAELSDRLAHLRADYDLTLGQLVEVLTLPANPVWLRHHRRRALEPEVEADHDANLAGIEAARARIIKPLKPVGEP